MGRVEPALSNSLQITIIETYLSMLVQPYIDDYTVFKIRDIVLFGSDQLFHRFSDLIVRHGCSLLFLLKPLVHTAVRMSV